MVKAGICHLSEDMWKYSFLRRGDKPHRPKEDMGAHPGQTEGRLPWLKQERGRERVQSCTQRTYVTDNFEASPKYKQDTVSTPSATSRWQRQEQVWCHLLVGTLRLTNKTVAKESHFCSWRFPRARGTQVPRIK